MAAITLRTPQNSSDDVRMSKMLVRFQSRLQLVVLVTATFGLFSGYIAIVFEGLNRMYDAVEVGEKPVYLPSEAIIFATCAVASSVLLYKSLSVFSKLLGSGSMAKFFLNMKSFRILVILTLHLFPINFYLSGWIFTIGYFVLMFRSRFWIK
jgi:hypothetical protein